MAVRLTLGAGRGSLVRLVLAESIVLAAIGAWAGLLLSSFLSGVLRAFLPIENSGLPIRTTPNNAVFFFTGGLAILTMLLFGLAPALQSTRPDPAPALKNETGSLSLAPTRSEPDVFSYLHRSRYPFSCSSAQDSLHAACKPHDNRYRRPANEPYWFHDYAFAIATPRRKHANTFSNCKTT